jgi:hypothetical protein
LHKQQKKSRSRAEPLAKEALPSGFLIYCDSYKLLTRLHALADFLLAEWKIQFIGSRSTVYSWQNEINRYMVCYFLAHFFAASAFE